MFKEEFVKEKIIFHKYAKTDRKNGKLYQAKNIN